MNEELVPQLPWAATRSEFETAASAVSDGACCVFVVSEEIPANARSGYLALIIAYARAGEPVTLMENGTAALLITEGGVSSGQAAARRMLGQLQRLRLERTLSAGVASLASDVWSSVDAARGAAATAGEVGVG